MPGLRAPRRPPLGTASSGQYVDRLRRMALPPACGACSGPTTHPVPILALPPGRDADVDEPPELIFRPWNRCALAHGAGAGACRRGGKHRRWLTWVAEEHGADRHAVFAPGNRWMARQQLPAGMGRVRRNRACSLADGANAPAQGVRRGRSAKAGGGSIAACAQASLTHDRSCCVHAFLGQAIATIFTRYPNGCHVNIASIKS